MELGYFGALVVLVVGVALGYFGRGYYDRRKRRA